jgi:hypothetical protein
MLTRKRAREVRERPKSCGFDPIMEACARFLEFADCGRLAQLNRRFHKTLWLYVLRSSNKVLNTITANLTSHLWIKKYAAELRSQCLVLNNEDRVVDLVQMGVTNVRHLRINNYERIPDLPIGLQSLHLDNLVIHQLLLPKFPPIKECFMSDMYGFDVKKVIQILPKTLETLSVRDGSVDFATLSMFPRLTTLEICLGPCNAMPLTQCPDFTKCPDFTTLIVRDVFSIECLRGVHLQRLVLKTRFLVDLSPLCDAQIDELDLRECPNFTWIGEFPHIKTIKQFSRK